MIRTEEITKNLDNIIVLSLSSVDEISCASGTGYFL